MTSLFATFIVSLQQVVGLSKQKMFCPRKRERCLRCSNCSIQQNLKLHTSGNGLRGNFTDTPYSWIPFSFMRGSPQTCTSDGGADGGDDGGDDGADGGGDSADGAFQL